jgi:exopolysaccharide biosynthesis polyprenyl glycosylphosphotransferase
MAGLRESRLKRRAHHAGARADRSLGTLSSPSRNSHVLTPTFAGNTRHQNAISLRGLLVGVDALGMLTAWTAITIALGSTDRAAAGRAGRPLYTAVCEAAVVGVAVVVGLVAIAARRLYRARVSCDRSVEITGLVFAAAVSAVAAHFAFKALGTPASTAWSVVGGIAAFVALAVGRSAYSGWLAVARLQRKISRPVVVVGSNEEAWHLYRLLELHPEIGMRVVGILGAEEGYARYFAGSVEWLGDVDGPGAPAVTAVRGAGANGVVVAASALRAPTLNRVVRELLDDSVHVHLSSGLAGVAVRRVRALPLAHEPAFYIEPVRFKPWQRVVKRATDIVVSTFVLIVTSPILVTAAIVIKLTDGGPVLFRQVRIGQDGRPFVILKLRSMRPGAELDLVASDNDRDGPLFKVFRDPRRTRVGRVLEQTSLDELPQLFNVLRGDMSLIGPRPATPDEVAAFDEELLRRHAVPCGVTGLWQVDARDNPSFDAYRRLDLFYVENWSLALDLAILAATGKSLVMRGVRAVRRGSNDFAPADVGPNSP